jgi:iron complex outermembrane recepter protein
MEARDALTSEGAGQTLVCRTPARMFHQCPRGAVGSAVRSIALAAVVVLLTTASVRAENKAEQLELERVDVVGTSPLPGIGVPLEQVPANVRAFSGRVLREQGSLTVGEFLDANVGAVTTNDSVGNPFQTDVLFRGFTASPVLGTPQGVSVFLDGVRVNEVFGDTVNWDLIPTNAIANINLIPGSNPLFGLNTLGGALSIHTKSGSSNRGTSVSIGAGSWGRRTLQVDTGGESGATDYFIAGQEFHERGWRQSSGSVVRQLFSKIGWQDHRSNLDMSLLVANNLLNGVQSLPSEMSDEPWHAYTRPDRIRNEVAMVGINGSHFLSETRLASGNLYARRIRQSGVNSNINNGYPGDGAVSGSSSAACVGSIAPSACDPYATRVFTATSTNGFGGSAQMTFMGSIGRGKNQLTTGFAFDAGNSHFSSDSQQALVEDNSTLSLQPAITPQTVRLAARNTALGLYATDTLSLTDKLHLTFSGRYNRSDVHLRGTSTDVTDDSLGEGDLNGRHRYSRFNPAAGVNFNPSPALNVYAGYNEGMRVPSPVELACADPVHPCLLPNAFGSDPDLKMVVARTWEAGLRGKIGHASWNWGVFRTQNNDDILFVASSTSGSGYFQNVGRTLREGTEVGLTGKMGRWGYAVNYAYVDARFETPFSSQSPANSSARSDGRIQVDRGSRIPGVPRQTFKARLDWEATSEWRVGANLVVASSQYARGDENNQDVNGKLPGYSVVHLDSEYRFSKRLRLTLKVINATNRQYATFGQLGVNEFTGRGRSFSADPSLWNRNDQFRSPAAPRAAWIGLTYELR